MVAVTRGRFPLHRSFTNYGGRYVLWPCAVMSDAEFGAIATGHSGNGGWRAERAPLPGFGCKRSPQFVIVAPVVASLPCAPEPVTCNSSPRTSPSFLYGKPTTCSPARALANRPLLSANRPAQTDHFCRQTDQRKPTTFVGKPTTLRPVIRMIQIRPAARAAPRHAGVRDGLRSCSC